MLLNQSAKKLKIFLVTALVTMKVLDLSTSTGQLLSELSCPKQPPTGVSSHPCVNIYFCLCSLSDFLFILLFAILCPASFLHIPLSFGLSFYYYYHFFVGFILLFPAVSFGHSLCKFIKIHLVYFILHWNPDICKKTTEKHFLIGKRPSATRF